MRELVKNEAEYQNFIDEVSKYCKYIQFSFDFDFGNEITNDVKKQVIQRISENSMNNMINLDLFSLLSLDYIEISMTSMGEISEANYPVQKVTVTSRYNQKISELLKTFDSLYHLTIGHPNQYEIDLILEAIGVDISLQERIEIEYTKFGMGSLNFLDRNHKSIISVSSTEGDFSTNIKLESISGYN